MNAGRLILSFAGVAAALHSFCIGLLDNPSDSNSYTFTVESKAAVSVIGKGPYYQFSTVAFRGGVTSNQVEDADLVKRYEWDFGNDGVCDTVLSHSDTMRIFLARAGTFKVALRLRDKLGAVSSDTATIMVKEVVVKAEVSPIGTGPFYQFDTVAFRGGLAPESIDKVRLVKEYAWDFGDSSLTDTVLSHPDTLKIRLTETGSFSVVLRLRDSLGVIASDTAIITVQKLTIKADVSPIGTGPFYQFDTVAFRGGVAPESIDKILLVNGYAWDFGNDGHDDTVLTQPDTMRIWLTEAGTYSIGLRLRDSLGIDDSAVATITVLPKFDVDVVMPDSGFSIDSVCAFYTQNEYTMRPVLLLGRYLTYRNKTESMTLGNLVFEIVKNMAGTLDYTALTLPYRRGFNQGIYTLGNDSITISAVFHYGPGVPGHLENDTIREDLFSPQSYIKSFKPQLTSPYYSLEKGPLWDLGAEFSVDVSNPLSPKVSLKVAMADLKFSCYREVSGRYTMSSEMNDTGGLTYPTFEDFLMNYHGVARIHPFRVGDIDNLMGSDSLEMDMAGSRIVTDSLPFKFRLKGTKDPVDVTFDFNIAQTMREQLVRFGNAGGNRKVLGAYSAQSGLSVNDRTYADIYFRGVYSTITSDTALFYCDNQWTAGFGTLYLDVPAAGFSTFDSERYGYRFTMKESAVMIAK